ncbi:ATP-binding cassette domain-containing protein [Streptomyces sp. NPDC090106]|uniref:ATP-binding cassette domain-containing protein n=1 Tax=Streptomyces sp. NPDC090106 TaxID=3365946 RepID=UPI0038141855
MIQAIGLTSVRDGDQPPFVDDLTFTVRPGEVTGLLGVAGAGKTTVLRLMLELTPGRGTTLFSGFPLHRHRQPAREVGVVLGRPAPHPDRTALSHLRMLAAAAGVPASAAGEVLERVELTGPLAEQRLRRYSASMSRRLALAAALLGDPDSLVLDEPAEGLSPADVTWLNGLLRSCADSGRTVLVTGDDARAMARCADRVLTLDEGRLVADQRVEEFERARLRPHVAVRSPQAGRLAAVLGDEHGAEVRREGGSRLHVYDMTSARVGETAFRHRILLHQLKDDVEDTGTPAAAAERPEPAGVPDGTGQLRTLARAEREPPRRQVARQPVRPSWPFVYELRRLAGLRSTVALVVTPVLVSALIAALLVHGGAEPSLAVLAGWAPRVPLPPAAVGAALFGALAFGQEFRFPALAPTPGAVPRRLRLLAAKFAVTTVVAAAIALVTLLVGALALAAVSPDVRALSALPLAVRPLLGWFGLVVGCAWAGLLGAAVLRSTALGMALVVSVPVALAPLLHTLLTRRATGRVLGLPDTLLVPGAPRTSLGLFTAQPMGTALALTIGLLLLWYVLTSLRGRVR